MRFRLLFSLFYFVAQIHVALSQGDKEFVRIGVEDGLSQSWVRQIVQDSYGFMWFGTKDGLNRYDGREFRVYRPDSPIERGLGNGSINELYIDSDSRLWVCTLAGVYLYNRQLDTFELFEPIGNVTASAICQVSDGSFWIGTPNELFHYFPLTRDLKRYTHDPDTEGSLISNIVWKLLEDRRGRLWVGTDEGLCLYDLRKDSFYRLEDAEAAGDSWVQSLVEDSWGRVWVGTEFKVFLYELGDGNRLKTEVVMPIRGQCMSLDRNGDIWLGHGSAEGVTFLEMDDETGDLLEKERYFSRMHDERSLSANGVECIHVDSTGAVWIGTYGDGINYYSSVGKNFKSFQVHDIAADLDVADQVNSILVDGSDWWIGTERGLIRFDSDSGAYSEYKSDAEDESSLGSNAVYRLVKDSKGTIWVGTWSGGLNRYVPETNSFVRYLHDPNDPRSLSNDNVFSIFEDRSGTLWIGTIGGGLNRFDRETETFEHYTHKPNDPNSINSQYINDIVQDSDGVLWVSTYSSLDRFDPNLGVFEHFSHTGAPLSQNLGDLEVIFIDSKGQFWLGTEVGLVLFDPQERSYRRYGVPDGLPNNSIKSISEDRFGSLWITTNYGLSQFVDGIQGPETPNFINYDRKDGLQSNEFVKRSRFVSETGEIWIGGVQGLSRFRPEEVRPNSILPQVLITDVGILNRKVFPSEDGVLPAEPYLLDELDLKYSDSVVTFNFSALVYPKSDDVKYAYKLEGFDEDWQFARNASSATYTNIDPGVYTFKVKSSNQDGIWGDNVESILVNIAPSWWMTPWFRVSVIAVASLLLFAIYRLRVISLKRSRIALAKNVADRTRELAAAKEVLSRQNEELRQHRTQLEDLVSERTKELEAARDKAEVSDRLKSAFIGNMSHEIRTPLNAIMGFSQLIAMEARGRGEYDDYSNCIRENTEMLVQLLNDIIDFSIFESEKLALNIETLDAWLFFHELGAEVAQLVRSRSPEGVEYRAENLLGEGICIRFEADKVRLRQILLNLATNACKFTETGAVSFGVSYDQSSEALKFWIRDTGVGIDPSEHEAVFERFHKIVDETKSFARGTGLGLAICRRLSEELGFGLSLESEVGVGSVFTLTIPITDLSKIELRVPSKEGERPSSKLNLVGRQILVAEDIVNNYTIVEHFLENTGARLFHALDGRQAVDLFTESPGAFDLLLLDISMPNMGGIEALAAIRKIDPNIPAIALTAHAFKGDVDSFLESGFQSCLTKPIEFADLIREISKQLDRMKL